MIEALLEAGLNVKTVIANPGFVRLEVTSGDETTELDLAADARLLPMEPGPLVPTLADEELAADKVLAVFGRAEARDFADLRDIEGLFGLSRLCELAKEKDPGFSLEVFGEMLGQLGRLRRDEFELDDASFTQLRGVVAEWRSEVEVLIVRQNSRRHDRGPELGR